ncbi:DUF2388 domain-containing protein [Pseudomonas rubra]|uniref:DUF2388 domain-containing protein n=1 Tax=Pseudomonas rubra TaxID=2942627 RepID=A0ABT5PFF7_9PSED|nr:DUF2388 domain-containing protein [Pseudomonas rubra]MDD1017054.1 DUF2388 domain-containing protein [Pseudomonas rubra]MDD1037113.1 DUF2388 domain-containing protein [Pseudomonas rubra]MDD1153774.1 DUF2388 domain-containing protein [Pseudomonas rubra]
MRKLIVVLMLGSLCIFPVSAGDGRAVEVSAFGAIVSSSLAVTLFPVTLTEDSQDISRNSSKGGDQKILAARNDAAAFVASDGGIRGASLEAVFEVLRTQNEVGTVSDIELAEAVLVYELSRVTRRN